MSRLAFVFDDDVLRDVEHYAEKGNSKYDIAHNIGIHYDTLRVHEKENPAITDAIKRGRAKGRSIIVNALFQKAKEGNLGAICYWLNNRGSEYWRNQIPESPAEDLPAPQKVEVQRIDGRKAANE